MKKKSPVPTPAIDSSTPPGNNTGTSTTNANSNRSPATFSEIRQVNSTDSIASASDEAKETPNKSRQHCQGVFQNFRPSSKNSISSSLTVYGENCVVNAQSNYKFGMVDAQYQVFAKGCNGSNCVNRSMGTKKVAHWSCKSCYELSRSSSGYKIAQTIRERAKKVVKAETALDRKEELTESDKEDLKNFLKCEEKHWSERGLRLRYRVKKEVNYYNAVAKLGKTKSTSGVLVSNGNVLTKDKFLLRFMEFYNRESTKPSDKQHLVYALLETVLAKECGIKNPKYSERILNLQLAMHSLSKKTADFFSANFNLASDRS